MVNMSYASIKCPCGVSFQVLRQIELEDGSVLTDWDESATAAEYTAHMLTCVGV